MNRTKMRIGDELVKAGLLSKEQLASALERQKTVGKKIGELLVDLEYVTEDQLLSVLSKQLDIPLLQLRDFKIDAAFSMQLPETFARQYSAILLKKESDGYLVGMTDPLDIIAYDELARTLKAPLNIVLIKQEDLAKNLNIVYRKAGQISDYAGKLDVSMTPDAKSIDSLLGSQQVDPPVRKFIHALFEDATQVNASDIHIEPGESVLRIRMRVDGVLREQMLDEKNIAAAVSQHLKLMAKINMTEKRLPLDGRFSLKLKNKAVDVRLSTMPTIYGESVVMRLLDPLSQDISLDKAGMNEETLKKFRRLTHLPHGVILVTGPTGSGKTTTLYGALAEVNDPGLKIITIEDPVEYQLERLCQVQVKPKIGLDFACVLRSILRQDPDIVLIGEMRDQETASIAMRAALTGHLVLSTIHTNDAPSTAVRLIDMGVPGYLVASTLQGILAQRLMRRICTHCKEPVKLTGDEEDWLTTFLPEDKLTHQFYVGKGCSYCNHIGYSGRIGIFELLLLNQELTSALSHGDENLFYRLAREALKGKTLLDQALSCAYKGLSTLHEVARVAGGM